MQTSAIVTMIKEQAPQWSRASILELLNQLHWIILAKPLRQTLVYDTSTGVDYKFTTTTGTYTYYISTDNGFPYDGYRVLKVYTGTPITEEEEVSDVHAYDATYSNPAQIVFSDDPSGSDVYVKYIRKPTSLSSEQVELLIPEVYHFSVVQGVLGMIELAQYGRSKRWDAFSMYELPRLWANMNVGLSYGNNEADSNIEPRGY